MLHSSRRLYLAYATGPVLLLLLLALSYASFVRLARANDWNVHTHQVLESSQRLLTSVINVQTGFRGYLLAGDTAFLEPLQEGLPAFEEEYAELRSRLANNPRQLARLERIHALQRAWVSIHIRPGLQARRRMDAGEVTLEEVVAAVQTSRGKRYVDGIKAVLAELEAEEAGLLARRAAEVRRQERVTGVMVVGGGILALVIALSLALQAVQRTRATAAANRRLQEEVRERELAEAAIARLSRRNELILDAAGEGIVGLDATGRATFANPAALRLTGFALDDLLGMPADRVFAADPDPAEAGAPAPVQEAAGGAPARSSVREFRRADGTRFPAEYTATPIREEGRITGAVLTFRDISERREVERIKDEFISVVSHELRTPLTSIRGSLGLLASGQLGQLSERGRRMLEIATQNTDRLVRLINDILDIERMESGRSTLEREDVELGDLLAQAESVVEELARKAGVRLEVLRPAEPLPLRVDPDRVVQVLTNLLSNAIKFSPPGTGVRVSVERGEGEVRVSVADQGRGIPPDKQRSVFERFQQVDASDSREKGGTGLGLAIARSIVEQHGGTISLRSAPGAGSTFTFSLPAARPAEPPDSGVEPTPGLPGAPLVLVCDDDPDVLTVVGAQLARRGYRVATAATGAEALEAARREPPAAVLLDLAMPGMDGWEVLARLKRDPATRRVPVVIFSALAPGDAPGAAGWVEKSSGEASLLEALGRSLGAGSRPARVLLVEDDPDLAEVLLQMFSRHGMLASRASTAREAVRLSEEQLPDLLVVDLVLDEGNGYEVVEALRGHESLRSVPVVVYSARDLDDEERERLRLGATDFLTKGRIAPEQFERRILALLDELAGAQRRGDA